MRGSGCGPSVRRREAGLLRLCGNCQPSIAGGQRSQVCLLRALGRTLEPGTGNSAASGAQVSTGKPASTVLECGGDPAAARARKGCDFGERQQSPQDRSQLSVARESTGRWSSPEPGRFSLVPAPASLEVGFECCSASGSVFRGTLWEGFTARRSGAPGPGSGHRRMQRRGLVLGSREARRWGGRYRKPV